jgi:hypothetical protein
LQSFDRADVLRSAAAAAIAASSLGRQRKRTFAGDTPAAANVAIAPSIVAWSPAAIRSRIKSTNFRQPCPSKCSASNLPICRWSRSMLGKLVTDGCNVPLTTAGKPLSATRRCVTTVERINTSPAACR